MGKKILVADSDSAVQQVATYFLKLEGFDVEVVGDGVSAMEAIEKITPDVILLTPGLPGINGIEVSQLVREKPQYKSIPILFLAESDEPLLNNIADFSHNFGIVNKPIDPTKLVNTLKEYTVKGAKAAEEIKESLKSIEELLGWEITGKKDDSCQKEAALKEEIPHRKSFDVTAILSGIVEEPEKEATPAGSDEVLTVERESEIISQKLGETVKPVTEDNPPLSPFEKGGSDRFPPLEKGGKGGFEVEENLRDRLTDEMIENMVRKIAVDIVERVTRELVPDIAEREIIKEIERLKSTE